MRSYEDGDFDAGEARRATEDAIRAGDADVITRPGATSGLVHFGQLD